MGPGAGSQLVSGAGDIKITKDGLVLLNEMVPDARSCRRELRGLTARGAANPTPDGVAHRAGCHGTGAWRRPAAAAPLVR